MINYKDLLIETLKKNVELLNNQITKIENENKETEIEGIKKENIEEQQNKSELINSDDVSAALTELFVIQKDLDLLLNMFKEDKLRFDGIVKKLKEIFKSQTA